MCVNDSFFVEIWSDVVCPFCYIGSRQFASALEGFAHRDQVVLRQRAFELDPGAPLSYDGNLDQLVATKYGLSLERARSLNHHLEDQAAAMGMAWALDKAKPTNTFDAHRLITLANSQHLGSEMLARLYRGYFSEGQLLSDTDALTSMAHDVGVSEAEGLWHSDLFAAHVRRDELEAEQLGVSGVPSILVDGKFMIVGSQGSQKMLEVLDRAWARRAA